MDLSKENEDVLKKYEELARLQNEKLELREQNINVDRSSNSKSSKMDLVNKFKNKLKDFVTNYTQIMKDIEKLNLSRFVGEVSKMLCEANIAQKDIILYIKFASQMHREYEEFGTGIQADLLRLIKSGGDGNDETSRANKRRNLMRLAFELHLVGLPVSFEKTFYQIKEIMDQENEDIFYPNMNTAVAFIQNFNEEYIGTVSRTKKREYAENSALPQVKRLVELVSNDKKEKVLKYFKGYLEKMVGHCKKLGKKLQEIEELRRQALLNQGKVDDDTEGKYTEARKKYQTTCERIMIVADHLDVDMPQIDDEVTIRFEGEAKEKKGNQKDEDVKEESPYENEEEAELYSMFIDLKEAVPDLTSKKTMQVDKEAKVSESPAKGKEEEKTEKSEEIEEPKAEKTEKNEKVDKTEKTEKIEKIEKAEKTEKTEKVETVTSDYKPTYKTYDDLAPKLEVCESRELADEFAKLFCTVNNGGNRKKLIKDICSYRKDYHLYVHLHFRILATLNKYFKDTSENLLDFLQKEYKYIKDKAEKEKRIRIIIYFCEATKFKLIPPIHIMDCLQECLNSPTGINIDVMIVILERTGVFLVRNKDKNDKLRFDMQLTQINNFRSTSHLSDSMLIQLENAYYICKPPERAALKAKKSLTPLENYIVYLLFERLESKNIAEEIIRLPIKECEDFLIQCFIKIVKKGRFGQINLISALARYLSEFYATFAVKLVDTVVEEIQTGMEENIFMDRQRRILMMKFLGELYNFTLIEIDLIFKILYFLLEAGNDPNDKYYKHIKDHKDDTFRVTLVCTLIESVVEHLKKKKYKTNIDKYLVFLQRYILSKSYLPINVEFQVLDVLDSVAPDLKKFKTLKEAQEACNKLLKSKEDEKDLLEMRVQTVEPKLKSEEEIEAERLVQLSKQEKQLDNELQAMIQESIQENNQFIQPRPTKLTREKAEDTPKNDKIDGKKITLCLRVGNRIVPKNIVLAKDSAIAQNITRKEEIEEQTMLKAAEATKNLHQTDIKKSEDVQYDDLVGNTQIKNTISKSEDDVARKGPKEQKIKKLRSEDVEFATA